MTTILTETSAFEQFKPLADRIEARMLDIVKKNYGKWVEASGGTFKHYRYNDGSREANYYRAVASFIKVADGHLSARTGTPMVLNEERLAKKAKELGEDSVLGFVHKLIVKLGNIEMTDLDFRGGSNFTIRATKNGHEVRVAQQTVYKMSRQWTHYCQFPARIYVDGKFTPAAKFEAATA